MVKAKIIIVAATIAITVAAMCAFATDAAYFVVNGKLIATDERGAGKKTLFESREVYELLGTTAHGKTVVSLGKPVLGDGYRIDKGVDIAILSPAGAIEKIVMENALRAYPAPVGDAIAIVGSDYSLYLYEGGKPENLGLEQRVTLVA